MVESVDTLGLNPSSLNRECQFKSGLGHCVVREAEGRGTLVLLLVGRTSIDELPGCWQQQGSGSGFDQVSDQERHDAEL